MELFRSSPLSFNFFIFNLHYKSSSKFPYQNFNPSETKMLKKRKQMQLEKIKKIYFQ